MCKQVIRVIVVLLFVFIAGCSKANVTSTPPATEAPVAASTEAPKPATEVPVVAPTSAPTDAPATAPTAVVITHLVTPGEPVYKNDQKVSDCNTGDRVRLGATTLIGEGCDLWDEQKLERPAAAVNGPYLASLDITSTWMGTDQQWLYGKIVLFEIDPAKMPADLTAAFEIDTDLDSRGEYLILARNITSTTWTTDGVQVWQDTDGLVGGGKPHQPDTASGNGYEALLFDSGVAADPDLAWVRLNTSKGMAIEFAFKPNLVPSNQVFAWWSWTFGAAPDPAKMEVADLQQNTATWNLDNTCGWIFNAKPTNLQINICPFAYPTAVPTITPTPQVAGCVQQSDSWCQAQHPTDPPHSWQWDAATCSCIPIN
jgi:hypothetical protein